jgi:hypothetical protein
VAEQNTGLQVFQVIRIRLKFTEIAHSLVFYNQFTVHCESFTGKSHQNALRSEIKTRKTKKFKKNRVKKMSRENVRNGIETVVEDD